MDILTWLNYNFTTTQGSFISCILLGIVWMVCYDFYHMLFSAVLSWFKK